MAAPDGRLERWIEQGLISPDQREAIEAFEGHPNRSSTSPAELLVYLGVAAVLGALVAVMERLASGQRGLLLSTLAVAAAVAGALLIREESRPLARAASVLWFLSVVFAAGAGAYLSGTGQRGVIKPLLFSGVPAFSFALFDWAAYPSGTQFLAVFASGLLVIYGLANALIPVTATTGGLILAAVGAAGLVAAARGRVEPLDQAYQLFGFSLPFGFLIAGTQSGGAWAELLSVAAAGSLLWASVRLRSTELLFVGAFSLSLLTVITVGRHFTHTMGVPAALLLIGTLLIGAAVLVARLRPLARNGDD
jgi:predicted membrane protein DUF2157